MRLPLPFLVTSLAASTAFAEPQPAAKPVKTKLTVERHYTTNALDDASQVGDWYSLLRGSIKDEWTGDAGTASIATEFELTRYDEQRIEDDRAMGVTVDATRRIGDRFELRGTVSYRLASTGDNLDIGPLTFGTRTLTQSLAAEAQLGIDLGSNTTLVVGVAHALDRPELSALIPALVQPFRLKPARDRFVASATLARALGPLSVGLVTSLDLVAVEAIGWPPANLSYRQVTVMGQASYRTERDIALAVAVGVQTIPSAFSVFEGSRPTYLASITVPVVATVEIAARAAGAFDSSDSDDPMASWVQRAEASVAWKPTEALELGGGVFFQVKENPLLENREHSHGFHLEGAWRFSRHFALLARAQYSREAATVIDTRQSTLDTFVGISANM